MKLKRGILYLSLHNMLEKKFGVNRIVSKKEIKIVLRRRFLIPKNMIQLTLKEMEEKKMIKRPNHKEVIIMPCDIKLAEDTQKIYQLAGLITKE